MKTSRSRGCPVPTCTRPDGKRPDELVSLDRHLGRLNGAIPGLPFGIVRQGLSGRSDASTVIGASDVLRLYRRCALAEISAVGRCRSNGIERRPFIAGHRSWHC